MMHPTRTKLFVSIAAMAIVLAHQLWADLRTDNFTTIFFVIAILPWFAPIIRSLELPGGFKVELQQVKSAVDKVVSTPRIVAAKASLQATASLKASGTVLRTIEQGVADLRNVANTDPNLALVGVGIEIEKRLRDLAGTCGTDTAHRSVGWLLRQLERAAVVPPSAASGLRDLIGLRNQAAHGTTVSAAAANWALDSLPEVLDTLDQFSKAGDNE